MVLKANDRRTSSPCHDEFRGPRSDCVRQVASDNNNNKYSNVLDLYDDIGGKKAICIILGTSRHRYIHHDVTREAGFWEAVEILHGVQYYPSETLDSLYARQPVDSDQYELQYCGMINPTLDVARSCRYLFARRATASP
ncbi:hypothetical protein TNCV_246411 [Trichonephila clavipes]|nr:hypothetical protein TNCV_246411 [Trichonephila clavipes]